MRSLYQIIDSDPDASAASLRSDYLRTIAEVHPDRARTPEEVEERTQLTAAVTAAWSILGDPERRRAYDQTHGVRRLPRPLRRLRRWLGSLRSRRWVVGRPHPRIALAPLGSALTGVGRFFYETRIGQWSLVIGATLLGSWLAGPLTGGALAAILGLLIASGGTPTPLSDARAVAEWFGALPLLLLRSSTQSIANWVSPRMSETMERERGYRDQMSGHLDRSSQTLAEEGRRPARPEPFEQWPTARRRRPRPPRGSGRPRSRRP